MQQIPPSMRVASPSDTSSTPREYVPTPPTPVSINPASYSRSNSIPTPISEASVDYFEHETYRRRNYSTPVSPPVHSFEPTYIPPRAPAPPSFPTSTAYDPAADVSPLRTPSTSDRPSRTRSLLNRIGTLRSSRNTRGRKYGALGDDEEAIWHGGLDHAYLKGVEEDDDEDGEGIGFDVSGFDGPIALQSMPAKRAPSNAKGGNYVEAGLVAEYERLEARKGNESIGFGMETVVEAPFLGTSRHMESSDVVQKVAEERGEILMLKGRCLPRSGLSSIA